MLKHDQPVGDSDSECTAGATLTDHRGDDGNPQAEHLAQIHGNGLTLPLLLRQQTGISPGRIDEGQNRQTKAVGMLHQAQSFAVATRSSHAEIPGHVLLGVTSLLMADQKNRSFP